jgi:hypothetical protein
MSMNNRGDTGSWRDVSQVNVRRSFVLMACGALLGLLLAGYALFTARGTSTLIVPAEDVALVNQQPISRSDYIAQLQSIYGVDLHHATAAQRQKVLNDMIREELFVQRGKELDVASTDPEVRSALVNAVEVEVAEDALTSRPTEAALRAYYEAHRMRYANEGIMTVHDFVFPVGERGDVPSAINALRAGPLSPELIARIRARESGKAGDEEFYFAAKIHLGDQLFEAARLLADGEVSEPIETADGIHVLYMSENKKPVPFDFADARDQVLNDYRNEAITHLNVSGESFLRKRANILIADDLR